MEFAVEPFIGRSREEVFAFFRDIHQLPRPKRSVVPVYDKITPGPIGVGTRIREVVRLFPFVGGEVISEVTGYEPPRRIDCGFVAFGKMEGELTYRFEPSGEGGTGTPEEYP